MIKAIICDLDGAYFVGGKEHFIKNLVKKYNLDEEVVRTMFLSSDEMMAYKRGEISDEDYWQHFTGDLKLDISQKGVADLLAGGYDCDEKITNLVRSLPDANIQPVICSNNFPLRVKALNEKFDFLKDFSAKVFSYEVGKLKLEGFDMFEKVVERSGLEKEEILMFDNGEENIRHAIEFGFVGILYEGYLDLIAELEKMGVEI